MTILPIKKTNKEKTPPEQPSHDHNGSLNQPSNIDAASSRVGRLENTPNRTRIQRHQNVSGSLAAVASPSNQYETVESSIPAINSPLSETFPSERPALSGKRRHGKTSPHPQPYGKNKPSRPLQASDGNSSSHNSRMKYTERSKGAVQSGNQRTVRRRQRSKTNENDSRYNSEDEYEDERVPKRHEEVDYKTMEENFARKMKDKKGFHIRAMEEDGSCLFRAVADQIYGDQNMADEVRRRCMDYMVKNRDYFCNFVTEDFGSYIVRKRLPYTHGNHLEMQAMAELYNRQFEVYEYDITPINIFATRTASANPPLRVSYHRQSHYNSVIDPFTPTIGVGLGLPSFHPGLADKNLLESAFKTSEQEQIEKQMLADKLRAADRDYTEEELVREISHRSLQEYYRNNGGKAPLSSPTEVSGKSRKLASLPCSSEQKKSSNEKSEDREAASSSASKRPQRSSPPKASSSSSSNSSFAILGNDWVDEKDEMTVMKRILMQSQQEYYEQLQAEAQNKNTSEGQQKAGASCSRYPTN